MDGKTAGELIQELVDIHCRTLIRFQRRQELLQEQDEDDSKFDAISSLLKPMLVKLDGPVHFQHGWEDHYAIRLDTDTKLVSVERMFEFLDVENEDDRIISDDCLASIEKELNDFPSMADLLAEELNELSQDDSDTESTVLSYNQRDKRGESAWQMTSNDGQ